MPMTMAGEAGRAGGGREAALQAVQLAALAVDAARNRVGNPDPAATEIGSEEFLSAILSRRTAQLLDEASELVGRAVKLLDPAYAQEVHEQRLDAGRYAPVNLATIRDAYIGRDPTDPKRLAVLTRRPPGGGPPKPFKSAVGFERRLDAERWLNYHRLERGLPALDAIPRGTSEDS